MIVFTCPHCASQIRVRPEQGGTSGRCPRCRQSVEVPRQASPPPELDFLAPPQSAEELGRLGGYRVLRVLGSGAMGVVFEAEDIRLHRRVALKVMKKAIARDDDERERFLKEARAIAKIEHDNIVTIYQVDEDRGVPFLAMKLLVGETLEDRLNRKAPLDPEVVIRFGREICEGLAVAHERGMVHRDIKPANIWIEEGRERIKILDFGLARAVDDAEADEEERNLLIGTPLYMAPEQARGKEIDARADLFSLGSVLYRAATGELPFKGRTARIVITSVLKDTPRPPREVNPAVPPYLSRLIMDLLEKSPQNRPLNAGNVIVMLAEALDRIDEVPPEENEPAEAEIDEEPSEAEMRRRPKPRKPRRKGDSEYTLEGKVIWWSVFAIISLAVLLAVLHIVRQYLL